MKISFYFLVAVILLQKNVFSQEVDSCKFYSDIFKVDSNLCNGLIVESFRWLTSNCIIKGETTVDEVEEIFGQGGAIRRSVRPYGSKHPFEPENTNPPYDYYWEFGLDFFCVEGKIKKKIPGTWGFIEFKGNIVVDYGGYSLG